MPRTLRQILVQAIFNKCSVTATSLRRFSVCGWNFKDVSRGPKVVTNNLGTLTDCKKIHPCPHEKGERYLSVLDEGKQREREELEFLIETLRVEHGAQVPEVLSPYDIKLLLNSSWDFKKKLKYLQKCYEEENESRQAQREKEEAIRKLQGMYDEDLNPVVRPDQLKCWMKHWKSLRAAQFGWPVVVDMDYDLDEPEAINTIKAIQLISRLNCEHLQPCWLHFTSAHKNVFVNELLNSKNSKNIVADFHSEHFLKLFPKERLFYLVPEGPFIDQEELGSGLIFILGGMADGSPRNRSYRKARELGIPFGSLPIERFVRLKVSSSRDIYLHYVIEILLDKMLGLSWKEALDARLPESLFEKYPDIQGQLPSKGAMKARRQFEKLALSLPYLKKENSG